MDNNNNNKIDIDNDEIKDWIDSFKSLVQSRGNDVAKHIIDKVINESKNIGLDIQNNLITDYKNTISLENQVPFQGDREIERKIKSIIRWNAMAMVVRANRENQGIGGHISSFASSASLYEVGFNHFFKGPENLNGTDIIYFQGHVSPGIYSRSYLEGRFDDKHLNNFRRDLNDGLTSYPHPWLMPDYWQFATVSMGLAPIQAIYQARFMRYLIDRKLIKNNNTKIWAFLGDGEMDEPESLGAITLASREKLNNLIFVINCNLQRLDGPVR